MSSFASSMKYEPIALPTPREPECSITHTDPFSSRQTSTKWLPPPSVPRCMRLLVRSSTGCSLDEPCEVLRQRCPARHPPPPAATHPTHRGRACPANGHAAPRARSPHARRAGCPAGHPPSASSARPSCRSRCRRRPRPGSRPSRRDDAAHGRALADVHVRHHRQVPEDERHARRSRELLARLVLDRHAARPHLHVARRPRRS